MRIWIAHRPEGPVVGRDAKTKLMQIGFAQHHRTGLLQTRDGAGADLRHMGIQSAAASSGRHASHVDVVFDHQGPAAQRLKRIS
jgi:hypothetical protein